jgi:hypothetical protein
MTPRINVVVGSSCKGRNILLIEKNVERFEKPRHEHFFPSLIRQLFNNVSSKNKTPIGVEVFCSRNMARCGL